MPLPWVVDQAIIELKTGIDVGIPQQWPFTQLTQGQYDLDNRKSNPPVLLIDEFSSGLDVKMKRDMWETLRNVIQGKAVTPSALANKVGTMAKKLLAVGTSELLSSRFVYEVHFACRSREDVANAQKFMSDIPRACMADDVATRFEVPIDRQYDLAQLFQTLSSHGQFAEHTVEKATLESIFMKSIRQNNVAEEDTEAQRSFLSWLR